MGEIEIDFLKKSYKTKKFASTLSIGGYIYQVEDTKKEIKISEYEKLDWFFLPRETVERLVREQRIKKDKFLEGEILKRLSLKQLKNAKDKIEREIQERNKGQLK